jgi:DNA-directed RNA polymerase specialized sigma24 family protein
MDDADIADALGVRRATVRSLVARGLAAMHRELDDD